MTIPPVATAMPTLNDLDLTFLVVTALVLAEPRRISRILASGTVVGRPCRA